MLITYKAGKNRRETSIIMLVLAGMVVNSLFQAFVSLKAVQHRTDLLRRQAVKKGRGLQKFFLLFAECAEHESILLI